MSDYELLMRAILRDYFIMALTVVDEHQGDPLAQDILATIAINRRVVTNMELEYLLEPTFWQKIDNDIRRLAN